MTAKEMVQKDKVYEDDNNLREDLVVKNESDDGEDSDSYEFKEEQLESDMLRDMEDQMSGSLEMLLQSRSNGDERSRKIVDSIDPDILKALQKGKSTKKGKAKGTIPV